MKQKVEFSSETKDGEEKSSGYLPIKIGKTNIWRRQNCQETHDQNWLIGMQVYVAYRHWNITT